MPIRIFFFFPFTLQVFTFLKRLSWNCEGSGSKEMFVISVRGKQCFEGCWRAASQEEDMPRSYQHTEVPPALAPSRPVHHWDSPVRQAKEPSGRVQGWPARAGWAAAFTWVPVNLTQGFLPPRARWERTHKAQGSWARILTSEASPKPPRVWERSQTVTKQLKKKNPDCITGLTNVFRGDWLISYVYSQSCFDC